MMIRQQQRRRLLSSSRSSSSFVSVLVFLMLRYSSNMMITTDATATTTTTTATITNSVHPKHTTSTSATRSTSSWTSTSTSSSSPSNSSSSLSTSSTDIYLIVEGNTVSYFYCNNKDSNKKNNNDVVCDINHIHHEQQLIYKSIQDIIIHYNNNNTTMNDSNNNNATTTITNTTIQQIDSSYKLINAIYIRITIHHQYHHHNDEVEDTNNTNTIKERTDDTYNNNNKYQQLLSLLTTKRIISYIQQHKINGIKNIYMSQQHHHQQQQQHPYTNQKQKRKPKKGKIHNNNQQQSKQNTQHQQNNQQRRKTQQQRQEEEEEIYSKPLRLVGVDIAHSMIINNPYNDNNNQQSEQQCHSTQNQHITGHDIRVAVMDSGIDYTHIALGGIGTKTSYTNAFGTSIYDIRNTQRTTTAANNETTLFPNHIIIDGYDILGDIYSDGQSSIYATNDTNPIDLNGHGTSITHIIRSIGPNIQFIGIKICTTFGTSCPDFAFIRGIEYLLDRNHNGMIDNYEYNNNNNQNQDHIGVHVINLSFGRMYTSSYYSILSKITEQIIAIGIVPVLSSGNYGNVPFILGDVPATPNAITVGATEVNYNDDEDEEDIDDDDDQNYFNNDTIAVLRNSNNNNEIRQKRQRKQQQQYIRTMAYYSSRGPVTGGNRIKPDLVSPGGLYKVALASTGNEYHIVQGTSFAAPFVTGGAALLKQKCRHCSPFAIKALLMNHATHAVYSSQIPISTKNGTRTLVNKQQKRQEWAPVTLQGSGEMQIHKSLMATYWVYSVEDMNPSISLGLINAATNTLQIQRTLRIVQLTNTTETLHIKYELRSLIHQKAISIQFTPEHIILDGKCQDEYNVTVTFTIQTQFAPSNHMYSGGTASVDPTNLDYNEIDGWIMISSNTTSTDDTIYDNSNEDNHDVGIPFHMLLRKAANVTIDNWVTLDDNVFSNLPTNISVNIENHGMEIAQIDIYQLLYVSTDQSESEYGSNNPPADIRYIGYRTIPVHKNNNDTNNHCDTLIEFAIQTWESQQSLAYTHFNIWIDLNFDEIADHTIYNSAYRLGSPHSEMRRIDLQTNIEYCIGYTPDHTTNTANTVLRFCSNDIGIHSTTNKPGNKIISVAISSYSFPDDEVSDIMDYRNITIPQAGLAAPSYDIEPGALLQNIFVSGTGETPPIINKEGTSSTLPLGLLLITNSFRTWNSTGSATRNSEALVIVRTGIAQYNENSPDELIFPMVQDVTGPNCAWGQVISNSTSTDKCNANHRKLISETSILPPSRGESTNGFDKYSNPYRHDWIPTTKLKNCRYIFSSLRHNKKTNAIRNSHQYHRLVQEKEETCPELTIPRLQPILIRRSEYPIPNETFYSAAPTTTIIPDQNNFNNTADPDITLPSNHHHTTIPPLTIIDIDDDDDVRSSVNELRYIHRMSGMFYFNMIMMIMFTFC